MDTLAWGWSYAGRLSYHAKGVVDWLRRAYINKSVTFAPVPQGIDLHAVREGLREITPPAKPPSENMYRKSKHNPSHKFPHYKDRVAPNWGHRRSINGFFGRGQQRRPEYHAQDKGRWVQREDSDQARYRPSSRSRSPRPEDNRGRAPSRDRRDDRPRGHNRSASRLQRSPTRGYDRPTDLHYDDHINTPTFNAYKLGEANAVIYDDHNGSRQVGYQANGQPRSRPRKLPPDRSWSWSLLRRGEPHRQRSSFVLGCILLGKGALEVLAVSCVDGYFLSTLQLAARQESEFVRTATWRTGLSPTSSVERKKLPVFDGGIYVASALPLTLLMTFRSNTMRLLGFVTLTTNSWRDVT